MSRDMNHYGWRQVSAEAKRKDDAIQSVEADTNVTAKDPNVSIRLFGKRGGNRYDQIVNLSLDEAEELGQGLLWLVAQDRGFDLDTIAQSVTCAHGDGEHTGSRFVVPA